MAVLFTLGVLLILLGLSGGSWHLWSAHSPAVIPAGRFLYLPGIALVFLSAFWLCSRNGAKSAVSKIRDASIHPALWAIGLLCVFTSDWIDRPYGFFASSLMRGEIIVATLLFSLLLRCVTSTTLAFLPLIASILLWTSFLTAAEGRLLFSDDHAMFLFRMILLKENFPSIPFWSPIWNGGIDARDFFATGALGPFLLASPLLYLGDPTSMYNYLVAILLWVLTPLSSFIAARIFGAKVLSCAFAATLSMCSSLFWYRWTLKYGTMGFALSSALLPLVTSLAFRVVNEKVPRWRFLITTGLSLTLMILWTPSAIALVVPLGIYMIPRCKVLILSPRHLFTLLLLICINAPWLCMLWKVSAVGKFLAPTTTTAIHQELSSTPAAEPAQKGTFRHKASGFDLKKSLKTWQESASAINPLILLLALPSLLALPCGQRALLSLLAVWLTLLGTVGVSLVPQLELDRMLVILGVALCYPVGRYVASLIDGSLSPSGFSRITAASSLIIGGFLFASPLAMSPVLLNRTIEQYSFASPKVSEMAAIVQKHAGAGRALFTGCVLHQLSGGHLAPLALWSRVPLIASSYAHNIWKYEQIIPKSFLERDTVGILDYFNRMNASVIFAHEPYWRTFLDSHPELFTEIWKGEGFTAYARPNFSPSYILGGEGTRMTSSSHSVSFTPLSSRVLLSFRYFPFLTAGRCKIMPFEVAPDLTLLALEECPVGEEVTIQSVSPVQRLLSRTQAS